MSAVAFPSQSKPPSTLAVETPSTGLPGFNLRVVCLLCLVCYMILDSIDFAAIIVSGVTARAYGSSNKKIWIKKGDGFSVGTIDEPLGMTWLGIN